MRSIASRAEAIRADAMRNAAADISLQVVSHAHVLAAAERIAGVARRTPIVTSRQLNAATRSEVYLKCENLQRTGAFKFRGAFNALSHFSAEERSRGVVTYSSGNHAQAVALAGRLTGTAACIVMPQNAPSVKLAATAGYGAEIITYDPANTIREELARRISAERGVPILPPYNHVDIIAGQGTAGLELIQEVPDLDVILTPCGGGGLLSGCALAAKGFKPDIKVIGVEPEAGDDGKRSFESGSLQTVLNPDTIADGARTPYLGSITFPIILNQVDEMATVSDAALIRAMRFVWERLKLIVEPTGVLGLAALMEGILDLDGARIGIVISGGNVALGDAMAFFDRVQ